MNVLFCRLLGTAKVPIMDLKRGGPQSKDVNTCLFDGSGQPLPSVRIRFSLYLIQPYKHNEHSYFSNLYM